MIILSAGEYQYTAHRFIPNLTIIKSKMQQQFTTDQLTPLPTKIRSPQGKLVYFYLEATGGATLNELNETLAMKKMAILSVLNSLSSHDLIEKDGNTYVLRT